MPAPRVRVDDTRMSLSQLSLSPYTSTGQPLMPFCELITDTDLIQAYRANTPFYPLARVRLTSKIGTSGIAGFAMWRNTANVSSPKMSLRISQQQLQRVRQQGRLALIAMKLGAGSTNSSNTLKHANLRQMSTVKELQHDPRQIYPRLLIIQTELISHRAPSHLHCANRISRQENMLLNTELRRGARCHQ